ncbi:guanylate kinase [Maritalea porphyrae]|jgi:guanylate kinase|uniref:guanylate kinase n=1 Tax=Maritalea porphyrae TaxID=880732 RepID=UPI0022AF7628|nr:guanylate kinase [Maritalea porphyrae]MCZ4270962.1 guanylate kinase [Maritalea porphyrae]
MFQRRGIMLILSSPSGAGKTSISRAILRQDANIQLSVSVTTRPKRANEVDGVDYHFKTVEEFNQMRDAGMLLEWAEVHGNFYATPKAQIDELLDAGKDVLFDIDYQGALQLYETCQEDIVGIFVLPPSIKELKHRLERRADDNEDVINRRLKTARQELREWNKYDYVIVNNDLEKSCALVTEIINAARIARRRQVNLPQFVSDLQDELESFLK